MVRYLERGPDRRDLLNEQIGQSLGSGLANFSNTYFANKALNEVLDDETLKNAKPAEKLSRLERALQPFGDTGADILQNRIGIVQQQEVEQQEALEKKKGALLGKILNTDYKPTEQEADMFSPGEQLAIYKAKNPPKKNAPGGLAGIPLTPEETDTIENVLKNNPNATPDEIGIQLARAGISPGRASPFIENKRRSEENTAKNVKASNKEKMDIHKDSEKFDTQLQDQAEAAEKQVEATKDILKAIKTGKVQPLSIYNALKGFGTAGDKIASAFKSAEQGKVEAAVPLLLEGWKSVFGVRITDADLKLLLDKLPSISNSPEANEAIIGIIQKYAKPMIEKEKIGRQIKKENGGFRPINYRDEINERYKKQFGQPAGKIRVRSKQDGKTYSINPDEGWQQFYDPA